MAGALFGKQDSRLRKLWTEVTG